MEHEICTCSDTITVTEDSYGQANLSRQENTKITAISHLDLLQKVNSLTSLVFSVVVLQFSF
jgi:hypothetical protein